MKTEEHQNSKAIFSFTSYIDFLRKHAEMKKEANPRWNFSVWARKLGLKSTSSLTKVLHQQRYPGPKLIEAFIRYFEFSREEVNYFRYLIELAKSANQTHLNTILPKDFESGRFNLFPTPVDTATKILGWEVFAIRELIRTRNFIEDPYHIQNQLLFPVSDFQIRWAIEALLNTNVIKRDGAGRLQARSIEVQKDPKDPATRNYFQTTLKQASRLLEERPDSVNLCDTTVAIERSDLPQLNELLTEFKKKIVQTFRKERSEQVVRLQIQLIPLTESDNSD